MTTRESFNPTLRTSELVPAFVAFAGVITLMSVSSDFFAAVGASAGDTRDAAAALAAGAGLASWASGRDVIAALSAGEARGFAPFFLPRTSMMRRSGSRSVRLVTPPISPTSSTIRTVDTSY